MSSRGKTLGIVGESGSGKSVCCYSLLGLIPMPPGRIDSGSAMFDGRDLLKLQGEELRKVRGNDIAFIFQDPMTSPQSLPDGGRADDRAAGLPPRAEPQRGTTTGDRAAGRGRASATRLPPSMPIRTSFPAACASA